METVAIQVMGSTTVEIGQYGQTIVQVPNSQVLDVVINGGPPGPQGPQGIPGQTGPTGPQGPQGVQGLSYSPYEDIEYQATIEGEQTVTVPTILADLFINGLRQSDSAFQISDGIMTISADLLIMVGDTVTITPK